MSTLKFIERAASSLPKAEQEQLLVFLTAVIRENAGDMERTEGAEASDIESLHPELRSMVGIIPANVDADEIHAYRLLKHS